MIGSLALAVLTAVVASVAAPRGRAWYAARLARRAEAGEAVKIAVRLRGRGGGYPKHWRTGTIRANETPATWRQSFPPGRAIALGGLTLVRTYVSDQHDPLETSEVLVLRDADGGVAELAVRASSAGLVHEALTRAPGARRRPRLVVPLWVVGPCVLALGWALWWAYVLAFGDRTTARVLRNDDGYCLVEWPGGRASVDCSADSSPGERVGIIAVPPPMRGEAFDTYATPWLAAGLFLGLVAAPAWWVAWGRGGQGRRAAGLRDGPALVDVADLPTLDAHDLVHSRISEALVLRAEAEGWAPEPADPDEAPPAERWSAPLRGMALSAAGWLVVPVFAGLVAAGLGAGWWANALLFDPATGATTTGTVVETIPGELPLLPHDVELRFVAGGEPVTANVASGEQFEAGQQLAIRYDPSRPSRARIDGPADATGRGAALTGAVALVGAGLAAWRIGALARTARRLRGVRALPPEPMRYALFRDWEGDFGVVLFDVAGDPPPRVFVSLWPPPAGVPVAGTGLAHGTVAEGELVVLEVAGRTLWPIGGGEIPETEVALALVNGVMPWDDEEPYEDEP